MDWDSFGLYIWNPTQGWYLITLSNPEDIALSEYSFASGGNTINGYTLAADFGSAGLWASNTDSSGTSRVTPVYNGSLWTELTSVDPVEVDVGYRGSLMASWEGYGWWNFNYYQHDLEAFGRLGWTELNPAVATDIQYPTTESTVYGVLGNSLFSNTGTGGSRLVHPITPDLYDVP